MPLSTIRHIILRAAHDPDYRRLLFEAPDDALADEELSAEERQCIDELDEERLAALAAEIDAEPNLLLGDIRI